MGTVTAAERIPAEQSDEALMLAVRSGQVGMLAELFERHHRGVYGFVYRMTSNREAAEDMVQEVFLKILNRRSTYQPRTSFTAWMYGIARNAVIDHVRRRRPESAWDDSGPEPASLEAAPDQRVVRREEETLLNRAIAALPPDKREVLVLSRFQNLRYEEIGRMLGCDPNTVKQRVFRAMRALEQRFGELQGRVSV
jgi:RNA polymerase sigma-70 factor (ECF subfamily)